jgi:very-short-patch-repair endonuclease
MNQLALLGWRVLRFTWEDVVNRPEHVVGTIRGCLALDPFRVAA